MTCTKCGAKNRDGDSICATCGSPLTAASGQANAEARKSRRKLILIIDACVVVAAVIAIFAFFSGGGNVTEYWPKSPPDDETVKTAAWTFDRTQISEDEIILSVSPSGKYILAADIGEQDSGRRMLTGKNRDGWIVSHISLYEKHDGAYTLAGRIGINADADQELNDTLATCLEDGVAWLGDETRVCVTAGVRMVSQYTRDTNADVFLIDFTEKTVKNLTGSDNAAVDTGLCRKGDDGVYFVRYLIGEDRLAQIRLMSVNVSTGELHEEADLSQDGIPAKVMDYAVFEDTVYYCLYSNSFERSGVYKAALGGGEPPVQILSVAEAKTDDIHPYIQAFVSVRVSPDGRYLCMSVHDTRIDNRDFPLVDHGWAPQSDPSTAKSVVTGGKWIPCHNVLLYDLRIKELVDPFTDAALQPDVVLAITATFAPDGKSLLCAVLFDGGPWTQLGMVTPTLYQIRLDTSTFDAVRVYTVELNFVAEHLAWHGGNRIRMCAHGERPVSREWIVIPAAFEGYEK